jgi:hypothetical protein
MNVTVPALIEQTVADAPSIVSTTGKPDVAVAVAKYGSPATVAFDGAVDANVIVCEVTPLAGATANDCCCCGAGA